jgi:hypothetical protein
MSRSTKAVPPDLSAGTPSLKLLTERTQASRQAIRSLSTSANSSLASYKKESPAGAGLSMLRAACLAYGNA